MKTYEHRSEDRPLLIAYAYTIQERKNANPKRKKYFGTFNELSRLSPQPSMMTYNHERKDRPERERVGARMPTPDQALRELMQRPLSFEAEDAANGFKKGGVSMPG